MRRYIRMNSSQLPKFNSKEWLVIFVIALVYFAFARAGLFLATLQANASPVWPATGFAIAILFLYGPRAAIGIALGAFAANWSIGSAPWVALAISIGNTGEAFAGAWILRRMMSNGERFAYQGEALSIGAASVVAPIVSATVGMCALLISGNLSADLAAKVWFTWWLGDALGGLVVAPVILNFRRLTLATRKPAHAFGATLATFAVCYFVFFVPHGSPFLFLLFPVILYAAHAGETYVLFTAATITAVSIYASLVGQGPFAAGSLNERLMDLQLFLAAMALTTLTFTGFIRAELKRMPALAPLACWILAGALFYSFEKSQRAIAESEFTNLIEKANTLITSRVTNYSDALHAGVGLYQASQSVDFNEWRAYAESLSVSDKYPGILGLGVIWAVKTKDFAKFENDVRASGNAKFNVKPQPGHTINWEPEHLHYVNQYLEPFEVNKEFIGRDMGADPMRRSIAEQARDTGESAITPKIDIFYGGKYFAGFLILKPIYKNNTPLDTVEQRRAALRGWVYGPVSYERYFTDLISQHVKGAYAQVFVGEKVDAGKLIFDNAGEFAKTPHAYSKIQIGPQKLTIAWTRTGEALAAHNPVLAWVGFGGALFSLLLTSLMVNLQVLGQRAQNLADLATAEIKKSRELLKQSERRMIFALEGSSDGIWDWDLVKGEMYVSEKLANFFGGSQLMKLEGPESMNTMIHPDDIERTMNSLAAHLAGESPVHEAEARLRDAKGEWKWMLTRGKVSELALNGRPTRMTGVHIDIDRMKKVESALESATKVKSQFLANMSHEIRTPINCIVGMAGLMMDTELKPEQRGYMENLKSNVDALLSLINDILDFSKIEAGKLEIENIEFDLGDMVSNLMKSMEYTARQKSLSVEVVGLEGLKTYYIGDPGRIRQIIANFLSNAIKFTPQGRIRLRVQKMRQLEDGTRLRFEVEDQGVGISKVQIEKLFKAFSQADASTTRKFGGTGLGLSISKQLVDLFQGEIGVISEENQGSTFWFEVTLKGGGPIAPKSLKAAVKVDAARFRGCRVLIAEDNSFNQLVLTKQLEKVGIRADTVANGMEAINALKSLPYDLVLMDCNMPEMDGFDATRAIRQSSNAEIAMIPIVAVTANAFREAREDCLSTGMNDFITKPILESELFRALDRWLPAKVTSVIQSEALRKLQDLQTLGEPDLVSELIDTFEGRAQAFIATFESALKTSDAATIADELHQMKSTSRTMGATELGDRCETVEKPAKIGAIDSIKEKWPALKQKLLQARAELSGIKEVRSKKSA